MSSHKVQRDASARNHHACEVGGLEEVEGRWWEQGRRLRDLRGASGDGSRLAAVRVGVGRVARHERVHRPPSPRWTPAESVGMWVHDAAAREVGGERRAQRLVLQWAALAKWPGGRHGAGGASRRVVLDGRPRRQVSGGRRRWERMADGWETRLTGRARDCA
jgi:hypothetical protein